MARLGGRGRLAHPVSFGAITLYLVALIRQFNGGEYDQLSKRHDVGTCPSGADIGIFSWNVLAGVRNLSLRGIDWCRDRLHWKSDLIEA